MQKISAILAEKGFLFSPTFDGSYQRDGSKWYRGVAIPVGSKTIYVARFGDWRDDSKFDWQSDEPATPEEAQAISDALVAFQKAESEEKKRIQDEVSKVASVKWLESIDRGTTPYLVRKQLPNLLGAKIDPERTDRLLVPARDVHGKLWGYQRVLAQKIQVGSDWVDKFFLKGMRIDGCFHLIGVMPNESELSPTLLIAEGFATAASLHLATGLPVAAAFNAGNLESVCQALRRRFPEAKLAVCGDDDRWTKRKDGTPWNPGREKASAAALAVGGLALFPRFVSLADRPTDFNDLHCREGLPVVAQQVQAGLRGEAPPNEIYGEGERVSEPGSPSDGSPGPGPNATENGGSGAGVPGPGFGELTQLRWGSSKKGKTIPPTPQQVADHLLKHYGDTLLRQEQDLFTYTGTHWKHLGTPEITLIQRQLQYVFSNQASAGQVEGFYKLFLAGIPFAPVDLFEPRPDFVNFLDGTLCLSRGPDYKWRKEFREHRRTDYLVNCIPLHYEQAQGAENPEFDAMLKRVFQGDADADQKIRAVRQMYGACLAPIKPHLFLLHGPGGSGKSSLIIPATRLVHKDNWCSVQPHELKGFNMESMVGKLVNFRSDIKISEPIDDDTVKMIEDRVPIRIDRKFKTALQAPLPAVHIFGANGIPPTLEGGSGAHSRRWTFIELAVHKTEPGKYVQDFGNWVFEQNPSGILAFALAGLDDLLQTDHYVAPESGLNEMAEWQRAHDPLGQFLHECKTGEVVDVNTKVMVGPTWRISKPQLWVVFLDWWKSSTQKPCGLTRYKFYAALKKRGYPVVVINGHETWAGIGTKEVEQGHF